MAGEVRYPFITPVDCFQKSNIFLYIFTKKQDT